MRIALAILVAAVLVGGGLLLVGDERPTETASDPAVSGAVEAGAGEVEAPLDERGAELSLPVEVESIPQAPSELEEASKPLLELEVRGPDDEPLEAAHVVVFSKGGPTLSRVTNAEGVARLDGRSGRGEAAVWKPSIPPHIAEIALVGRQIVRMNAGRAVAGRVLVGRAAPTVPIEIELHSNSQLASGNFFPKRVWDRLPTRMDTFRTLVATTDEYGWFRFAGLPENWSGRLQARGPYVLESAVGENWSQRRQNSWLPLRSPREGVELRFLAPLRIIGRVVDEKGRPVAQVDVIAQTEGELESFLELETDEDGRFEAGIPRPAPARIKLRAHTRREERNALALIDCTSPSDELWDLGDITLFAPRTVLLTVLDAGGVPLERASACAVTPAELFPRNERGFVRWRTIGPISGVGRNGLIEVVLPSGARRIGVAAQGYELVEVDAPPEGIDHLTARLRRFATLEVELDLPLDVAEKMHRVTASVQGDQPVFDHEHRFNLYDLDVGQSDPSTRKGKPFHLTLSQLERPIPNRIRPEVPLTFRLVDRLEHVLHEERIAPLAWGEHRLHKVQAVRPAVTLRLRVVDEDDVPIHAARVIVERKYALGLTDEEGSLVAPGLGGGSFALLVIKYGFEPLELEAFDFVSTNEPQVLRMKRKLD